MNGIAANMKAIAVIPAGGTGKRMQSYSSKQYLPLNGIPILVHTLNVFQNSPVIHEVFLVVPDSDIEFSTREIVHQYGLTKVTKVLSGGQERQDSVKQGIDALGDGCDVVVIHDGVRPFVSGDVLKLVVSEAFNQAAVTMGVPVKETVKTVDQEGWVSQTLDRKSLWLTQTPQAFKREIIQEAYRSAYSDCFYGTDDASLVERIGVRVKMLPGSYDNIKITTKDDLLFAERILRDREITGKNHVSRKKTEQVRE
jgi:2-C-methyl-D-erythritol 4-phosphate cytidylyltransferase